MQRHDFHARIEQWSARLRVHPTQVRIQSMTRKWASCSPHGRVTFARDLLYQPVEFQDYVIAHELLHLRIPNHGKLFESVLRAHLPGNSSADGNLPDTVKIPIVMGVHKHLITRNPLDSSQ